MRRAAIFWRCPRHKQPRRHSEELPRSVYLAVAGLACLPIGLLWDISHHSTIGRDTFWTPAHIIIQLGGIVPALLFASIALKTTFRGTSGGARRLGFVLGISRAARGVGDRLGRDGDDDLRAVRRLVAQPLRIGCENRQPAARRAGDWECSWSEWVCCCSCFPRKTARTRENRTRSGLICALAVGVMIAMWADFATEFTWPNLQHASYFYAVVSTPFPLLLLLAARASKVRAGATIAAATYMLIYIGMILVLPLFPAHPKLAPVYHPVDHMVPPAFPLLLIVPAVAIDVISWLFARSSKTATTATSGEHIGSSPAMVA